MKRLALAVMMMVAVPAILPAPAQAAATTCQACWANRTGCGGNYFLQSCNEGTGQYAYYRSKSTTSWGSKCSDGTYYYNNDCSHTFKGIKNVCRIPCVNLG